MFKIDRIRGCFIAKFNNIRYNKLTQTKRGIVMIKDEYQLMKICKIEKFGVIVKLEGKTIALCHSKKLVKKLEKYSVGDYIWGKEIESYLDGKHNIKECPYREKEVAFDEFAALYTEGEVIKGRIASIDSKNGLFINIYPWFNGLFRKNDYNDFFNESASHVNQIVYVQIGRIDTEKKRVTLFPVYKKNINVSVEIEGVEKDKFLDAVEINSKVCDSYRECTDNTSIKDVEIKKILADSYEKAVEDDAILVRNDAFTFQLVGKTKYGGVIAAGGKRNQFEGKKWFINFIGSSSKLVSNAINLFAYVEDWLSLLRELEVKLLKGENWNYKSHYSNSANGEMYILKQYLNYTFYCAKNKNLIAVSPGNDLAVFNTGLVDSVYEAVYMCFVPSDEGAKKKWKYEGFCTYGTGYLGKLLNSKMAEPPEKVQYFTSINDMLFDTTKMLNWDKEHILIENIDRLPIEFIESQCDKADLDIIGIVIERIKKGENKQENFESICKYIKENIRLKRKLLNRLDDAVSLAVKRCEWNYKTAIPIYYHVTNGISLLLPLCLSDDEQSADVALVVEKQESGNYQGQTILTLQMAYLDARLICRPNSEWLDPDIVMEDQETEN